MGFTTGLTGGVTLTLGIAYLTVLAHERNRQAQAQALRSQSRVLLSLVEPAPQPPPRSRAEIAREERSSLIESVKDRWNEEVEGAVRWVQRTDWNEVRDGMENAAAKLLGGGLQKSREGIADAEAKAGPKVQEAVDRSKIAAAAKEKLDEAGAKAGEVKDAAKAKADTAVVEARSRAQGAADSIRNSGGTVDAARGAVRDVITKGIEKGREVIGKTQATVEKAAEKIEEKVEGATISPLSPVERALQERYEKPDGLNKSVQEVLEERYKPVESRDNTTLRGL